MVDYSLKLNFSLFTDFKALMKIFYINKAFAQKQNMSVKNYRDKPYNLITAFFEKPSTEYRQNRLRNSTKVYIQNTITEYDRKKEKRVNYMASSEYMIITISVIYNY